MSQDKTISGSPGQDATSHRLLHYTAPILAACCLFFATQSHAGNEIYKWVDDKGVTHYSARPPEDGRLYEEVKVRNRNRYATQGSTLTASAPNNAPEAQEPSITQPGREVSVQNPEKVAQNCARARKNIATINSKRRVSITGEDGEQRRLNDDERAKLMQESQQYLERWCDNG
ncbi:MAG: DUF4124 domain-containing protein [Xanthomonadales bacterium]|nr:DUF4124 domain-containing protein [Xanthomonadales bacterium]